MSCTNVCSAILDVHNACAGVALETADGLQEPVHMHARVRVCHLHVENLPGRIALSSQMKASTDGNGTPSVLVDHL